MIIIHLIIALSVVVMVVVAITATAKHRQPQTVSKLIDIGLYAAIVFTLALLYLIIALHPEGR